MEEYSAKFVNLIIKGDLQEAEEICIACYIAGLRFYIARVVFLHPYHSLQDVMKLALKVGAQKKYGNSTTTENVAKERYVEGSSYWNPSCPKTTLTPQIKNEVQQESISKSKMCFKCQGLEHITSECPNRKVVDLVDEDEAKEEDVEDVIESNHVPKDEEKSSLSSESELKIEIKVGSDVIDLVVVQEIKSEKEIPLEVKPILGFVNVMLEEIPHGLPPMRDIQHQISLVPCLVFPIKLASIMSLKDHEELKTQVDDLLDKRLVQESESSYVVPTMLVHEKDGSWRMCFDCQAFNNFFIHKEVRLNIGQRAKQYEKQASEGYQRLAFDPGGWIRLHMRKENFLIHKCSKLCTRVDGPSKIIKKIGENAYKLELPHDYNILPTSNVKDLRSYHSEDLRASLFSQL